MQRDACANASQSAETPQGGRSFAERAPVAQEFRMTGAVPLNDLALRIKRHGPALSASFQTTLSSNHFVLGSQVAKFERQFAAYIGTSECVGVANGTDAIELALRAAGIGDGDRVATVANAAMYATTAIHAIGARPLFMDIDAESFLVTPARVTAALTQAPDAVVVTHLYGKIVPGIKEIARLCDEAGARLIEDCAQAHGANLDGQKAGSFGIASAFSFYPTKNLGALGDGGAVCTNNDELAQRLRQLRQYGWKSKYRSSPSGGRNSRLDEMQAGFLATLLPFLDAENEERRSIAQRYATGLHPQLVGSRSPVGADDVAHLFVIASNRREELREYLASNDVGTDVHYPIPDHQQPINIAAGANDVSLPTTEQLCSQVLSLPCFPGLAENSVQHVIQIANQWAERELS